MSKKALMVVVSTKGKLKAAFKNFLTDERSAKGQTEEGWMVYAVIIIGILVLAIVAPFIDTAFNSIGNFFNDGVNGTIDQGGLNQWGDESDGFNRE